MPNKRSFPFLVMATEFILSFLFFLLLVVVFMESSRRRNINSLNRSLPRGSSMPAWEKEFCEIFSSMEWETFQHKKKFINGYGKVMQWNDSAGKEAFRSAKNRFWATKEGLSCNKPLPDPELYIDNNINWDSEEDHDPRVNIFGDFTMTNIVLPPICLGDGDESLVAPASNDAWQYKYYNGYMPWEGGWNYANDYNYVGPWDDGDQR